MDPKWTFRLAGRKYLVLEWDGSALEVVENPEEIEIDFNVPQSVYDPRMGCGAEVLPTRDYFTADLWVSGWIQEQWRQRVPFELEAEGVDWGEVLAPVDPDVKY